MIESTPNQFVSIGIKKTSSPVPENHNFTHPLVDSFFLVSICASLLGMVGAGIFLWLIRTGFVHAPAYYLALRSFHIDLLIFGFFGTSVAGFVIQSAPRILGITPMASKPFIYFILLAPFIGIAIGHYDQCHLIGRIIISSGYIFSAAILILRQKNRALRPHSLFVLLSLFAFAIGAFLTHTTPQLLALLWLSTGAALLGTAHIFIANILGGTRMHPVWLYILLAITILTGACMLTDLYLVSALGGTSLSAIYIYKSNLYKARLGRPFLRIGFQFGFMWLALAWVLLVINPAMIDQTLHLLALGWAVSILYPLSIHICSYLAAHPKYNDTKYFQWLCLWQLVPASRGLLFSTSGPLLPKFAGTISLAFLIQWAYTIICLRAKRLKRKNDKHHN